MPEHYALNGLTDNPFGVFLISLALLWFAAWMGTVLHRRQVLDQGLRDDFSVNVGAALTLLGLIIGFSFSMATNRYDQRKNLEEAEANAIGTEYLRADLLPAAQRIEARSLLRQYVEQRLRFYTERDPQVLQQVDHKTTELQNQMWSLVVGPATAQPSPIVALAVAGMNDVINSQGYTLAAWRNRIPTAAWALMVALACCCNLLLGFGARKANLNRYLRLVLPLLVSISFFLIADIDSPRGGVIRVAPQNLSSLLESLPLQ